MAKNGTVAYVEKLPKCDIHPNRDAVYDASVVFAGRRTWGYVCEDCFRLHSGALGVGRGQRLEVRQ